MQAKGLGNRDGLKVNIHRDVTWYMHSECAKTAISANVHSACGTVRGVAIATEGSKVISVFVTQYVHAGYLWEYVAH